MVHGNAMLQRIATTHPQLSPLSLIIGIGCSYLRPVPTRKHVLRRDYMVLPHAMARPTTRARSYSASTGCCGSAARLMCSSLQHFNCLNI